MNKIQAGYRSWMAAATVCAVLAVFTLVSCSSGAPAPGAPQSPGRQPERLRLPYARDEQVYWTGGPHEFANLNFAGTYEVGRGSGLDFAGGSFNVLAMASGNVVEARCDPGPGFGCRVTVESPSVEGYPQGIRLTYAHLNESGDFQKVLQRFRQGSFWVPQGTVLGQAGSTGQQASTHLHVELEDSSGRKLEWGDGRLLVDGYVIYNYLADAAGQQAHNYDGSAVRVEGGASPRDLQYDYFYYRDYDNSGGFSWRAPQTVRVHTGFECRYPRDRTRSCEDRANQVNNDQGQTKFALGQHVYGFLPDTVAEDAFATPATLPPPPAVLGASTTISSSTVLVFDTSGSMNDLDSTQVTKLEAAVRAGMNILNLIAAENELPSGTRSQVGIVDFNNTALERAPLSTDTLPASSALRQLMAEGATAMPDGLQTALGRLAADTFGGKQIIILLSDGMPNVELGGMYTDEDKARRQSLELATQAGQRGVCIYTVGFGEPGIGSIDEAFLRQVSANSGCGAYYNAQNANDLARVYMDIRHGSTGNVLLQQGGQIAQGQQVTIGTADIPDNQAQLLMTLNWPGSRLTPVLMDPNGTAVDNTYPGAVVSTTDTIASIIVDRPGPGRWQVAAVGSDVPTGTTNFYAVLSARPAPDAPEEVVPSDINRLVSSNEPILLDAAPPSRGLPIILIILIVVIGGLSAFYIHKTGRGSRPGVRKGALPKARLMAAGGELSGRVIPIQKASFLIGRSIACDLRLSEANVSRQHARIQYSQGGWFIQDMNSRHGTLVNGQRITATRLRTGDRIMIGSTTLVFQLDGN